MKKVKKSSQSRDFDFMTCGTSLLKKRKTCITIDLSFLLRKRDFVNLSDR